MLNGSIDTTHVQDGFLILEGWALLDGKELDQAPRLFVNGVEVPIDFQRRFRDDLVNVYGEDAKQAGLKIRSKLRLSPFDYPRSIVIDPGEGWIGKPLSLHKTAAIHSFAGALTDPALFWRHIQNPASRLKHEGTLAFIALRAVAKYRRKPAMQAAALTVLVWRDLLDAGVRLDHSKLLRFGKFLLVRLNAETNDLGRRWYVSLANALAFLALKHNNFDVCNELFNANSVKTEGIKNTWLCVPNGTTARFMLGLLALQAGELKIAMVHMDQAVKYFQDRLRYFKVDNTWSFDELTEVSRLAQQAFQVYEMLRGGADSKLLNANSDLDLSRVSTQLISLFYKKGIIPKLKVSEALKVYNSI